MQAEKYRFHKLNLDDHKQCKVVEKIHKRCFPDDDVLSPKEGGFWWVVKLGAEVVGFCAMRRSTRWTDTGYLWRSAVVREHRGKGLQKRMIKVREKEARRQGWVWLISDTNDNTSSANNLIKSGYTMYDPSWPYGVDTTCYWRKRL